MISDGSFQHHDFSSREVFDDVVFVYQNYLNRMKMLPYFDVDTLTYVLGMTRYQIDNVDPSTVYMEQIIGKEKAANCNIRNHYIFFDETGVVYYDAKTNSKVIIADNVVPVSIHYDSGSMMVIYVDSSGIQIIKYVDYLGNIADSKPLSFLDIDYYMSR